MKIVRLITIFLLLHSFIGVSSANQTEICLTDLESVPEYCNFTHITFRQLKEIILPNGTFQQCAKTVFLNLSNNHIVTIRTGAFMGLDSLEELYLSGNKIQKINSGTLKHLSKLRIFEIRNNNLTAFPEYEITSTVLSRFIATSNQIEKFSRAVLNNTNDLIEINLSDNLLVCYDYSLSGITPAANIVLSYNGFQSLALEFETPEIVPNNTTLILNFNFIRQLSNVSLGEFYKLDIVYLDLSFNSMLRIDVNTFEKYGTIETLLLNNNFLFYLEISTFESLTKLIYLDLSHNHVRNNIFDLIIPGSIKYLNYAKNRIEVDPNDCELGIILEEVSTNIKFDCLKIMINNKTCDWIPKINLAENNFTNFKLCTQLNHLEIIGVDVLNPDNFSRKLKTVKVNISESGNYNNPLYIYVGTVITIILVTIVVGTVIIIRLICKKDNGGESDSLPRVVWSRQKFVCNVYEQNVLPTVIIDELSDDDEK